MVIVGDRLVHQLVIGELDATERILALDSVGPSMDGDGTMVPYQDIIEFKDGNTRVLTARTRGKGGAWEPVMKAVYRRKVCGDCGGRCPPQ